MEIETTGMRKKIFSCTDSAVVKVEKVVSKVAIGQVFIESLLFKELRKKGQGVLVHEGHLFVIMACGGVGWVGA